MVTGDTGEKRLGFEECGVDDMKDGDSMGGGGEKGASCVVEEGLDARILTPFGK